MPDFPQKYNIIIFFKISLLLGIIILPSLKIEAILILLGKFNSSNFYYIKVIFFYHGFYYFTKSITYRVIIHNSTSSYFSNILEIVISFGSIVISMPIFDNNEVYELLFIKAIHFCTCSLLIMGKTFTSSSSVTARQYPSAILTSSKI